MNYFTARSTYVFVLEKGKTVDFSETIVVDNINIGKCSQLNKYTNLYEYQSQGHSLTFVEGHSDSTFSNFFSLETARLTEAKFHVDPPWDERMKIIQMVYGTWPRWRPCSHIVKTFKHLLFWNPKADDLETWFAALVTRVLPNLFKWWPWVDLDLLYSKVKFGPFCFCMGKCLIYRFPRNYWSLLDVRCQIGTYISS